MSASTLDARFSIRQEWTGHPKQQWVVRFCGNWVGSEATRAQARQLAIEWNRKRLTWD